MEKRLTASLEDYLETIAELTALEGHAHTKIIAEKLHVKMPSVTGALRQLEAMGYIVYNTHYPVELTEKGYQAAEAVTRRHQILKNFFAQVFGLPVSSASETACQIEHVVDETIVDRFLIFSEALAGRSDAAALRTFLAEAIAASGENGKNLRVLSTLSAGTAAVFEKFGRNLNGVDTPDLAKGDAIVLESIALDRSSFSIACGGRSFELPLEVAENLWVDIR